MAMNVDRAYEQARERYAEVGADAGEAIGRLASVSLSLPCWQGDDVGGFERAGAALGGGGIQVTGNRPGKARNPDELRADLAKALSLIPGKHRVNLHAMYGDFGGKPADRDRIEPRHFEAWMAWARDARVALDFNATLFSHPKAASGFTLSHRDPLVRSFWIEHVRRCRGIAAEMGRTQGSPCLHDLWIPDGSKDACPDRAGYRDRLRLSLEEILLDAHDPLHLKDAVESKLFGIGSETFVAGSHEFYLGYALSRGLMVCLDLGHFHPTESVADKVSAILAFSPELLLHVSRGVRWDSDHVPVFDDALRDVAREIVRAGALGRVHLALDFFDATWNRVGAWVAAARAVQKALLEALLEPRGPLLALDAAGDPFRTVAFLEELKVLPLGAVYDRFCETSGVPPRDAWVNEAMRYEKEVLLRRER
jgi:L-rhamnose isomerase